MTSRGLLSAPADHSPAHHRGHHQHHAAKKKKVSIAVRSSTTKKGGRTRGSGLSLTGAEAKAAKKSMAKAKAASVVSSRLSSGGVSLLEGRMTKGFFPPESSSHLPRRRSTFPWRVIIPGESSSPYRCKVQRFPQHSASLARSRGGTHAPLEQRGALYVFLPYVVVVVPRTSTDIPVLREHLSSSIAWDVNIVIQKNRKDVEKDQCSCKK